MAVECRSTDVHVTAQKVIAIKEPIRMFDFMVCYTGNLSFHETNCNALYGEPFQIQIAVNAGGCQDDNNIP